MKGTWGSRHLGRISKAIALAMAFSVGFAAATAVSGARGDALSELEAALPGTKRQAVKQLDRNGLKVILNERMEGVNLEGWSTKALTDAETDAMLKKFGVRVVANAKDGSSAFLAPDNVGRAGILEGEIYLKMDGKIYKGLTLKGYGGNTVNGHQAQPGGSLDFAESFRDMEVSTILAENKVDTYVGVVSVKRPATAAGNRTAAGNKSNYVRLSRTALRMEDFIRIKGKDLVKLTDYMTDLLADEMGRKLTVSEFDSWLTKATADVMARKDYIRFQHASITESNLGIGELVDLGDSWGGAGMRTPGQYASQNAKFKEIARAVHDNLAGIDSGAKSLDFESVYDAAYEARLKELQAFDRARVNLSRATEAELTTLGFTAGEALEVVKFNQSLPDGIIDPMEVKTLKAITRDVTSILERATTDFLRLADGSQLAAYYIRNVGGADGVRSILEEARSEMKANGYSLHRDASGRISGNVTEVNETLERLALSRAKALGFERAVTANEVTNLSKFIATQAVEIIVRR